MVVCGANSGGWCSIIRASEGLVRWCRFLALFNPRALALWVFIDAVTAVIGLFDLMRLLGPDAVVGLYKPEEYIEFSP